MGQFCSSVCDPHNQRDEGPSTDLFQFYDQDTKMSHSNKLILRKSTLEAMGQNDSIGRQLQTLKYFIPDDVKESLPDSFRLKYIQQLLEIRLGLFQKMKEHTDKYNGSCVHKEKLSQFEFNNADQYSRHKKDRNPQEERDHRTNKFDEISKLTPCDSGKLLNSQMNQCVEYLWRLGNTEGETLNLCIQDGSYGLRPMSHESELSESKEVQTNAYFIMQK